jgi:hypothetical protein
MITARPGDSASCGRSTTSTLVCAPKKTVRAACEGLSVVPRPGLAEEALAAEQRRIETERTAARRLEAMAAYQARDVFELLEIALGLVDERVLWDELTPNARRLTTQAIFVKLIPIHADEMRAQRQPVYEEIALLAEDLASGGHETARQIEAAREWARNGRDPGFRGHGSYLDQWRRGRDSNPRRTLPPLLA